MRYAKAFVPLESDPEIFTQLACRLGLTSTCAFEEVFDLDDIDPLHNVLAYILLFPTSESYEQDLSLQRHDEPTEGVIWYKQTINNACGLYAILHALSNGRIRSLIKEDSFVASLIAKPTASQRMALLENSEILEEVYGNLASNGQTRPPTDPSAEVGYHYICFVEIDAQLYELNGDQEGPVNRGKLGDKGDFSMKVAEIIKELIERENGSPTAEMFSVMKLCNKTIQSD